MFVQTNIHTHLHFLWPWRAAFPAPLDQWMLIGAPPCFSTRVCGTLRSVHVCGREIVGTRVRAQVCMRESVRIRGASITVWHARDLTCSHSLVYLHTHKLTRPFEVPGHFSATQERPTFWVPAPLEKQPSWAKVPSHLLQNPRRSPVRGGGMGETLVLVCACVCVCVCMIVNHCMSIYVCLYAYVRVCVCEPVCVRMHIRENKSFAVARQVARTSKSSSS